MTRYFTYGNVHHSNNFCETITDIEYQNAHLKFASKFWGEVDNKTWARNNDTCFDESGELMGKYPCSNGNYLYFITLDDRSYTFVCTSNDIEGNEVEKFKKQVAESRRGYQTKSSYPFRRRS